MNDLTFLFVAFALIWSGTLGYLARLSVLRKQLEERITNLEERAAGRDSKNA